MYLAQGAAGAAGAAGQQPCGTRDERLCMYLAMQDREAREAVHSMRVYTISPSKLVARSQSLTQVQYLSMSGVSQGSAERGGRGGRGGRSGKRNA